MVRRALIGILLMSKARRCSVYYTQLNAHQFFKLYHVSHAKDMSKAKHGL